MSLRIVGPALALTAALTIGGCASYGHNGYGYSRTTLGYRVYDEPYYGWYGDYYYPGVGYYVYDRRGSRHRWSDHQRRYWEGRSHGHRRSENWSGYRRDHRDWRDGDRRDDHRGWRNGNRHDDHRNWRNGDRREEQRSDRRREWRDDHRRDDRRDESWSSRRFGQPSSDDDDRPDRHRPR